MPFERTNAMGNAVGKTTAKPNSNVKQPQQTPQQQQKSMYVGGGSQGDQKQVQVTYGHGGGKAYSYLAPASTRAGQMITPPVTHHKSGKTYKTLGRVVSTSGATTAPSINRAEHLANNGILLKHIGKTDQTALPGYYVGWGKDALASQQLKVEERLKPNMLIKGKDGNIKSNALLDKEREIDKLRYSGVKFKNKASWDSWQAERYNWLRGGNDSEPN